MATKFQIKRTSVSGRTPNTADPANTSYISAGELALNLTDKKLYSSNGTVAFEVGANLTDINISNLATFGNSSVNTTINSSSIVVTKIVANGSQGSTGDVLFSDGTAAYWSPSGALTTNVYATFVWANDHTFSQLVTFGNSTVNTLINSTAIAVVKIIANNVLGSNGQILYSNGSSVYWANSPGTIGVQSFVYNITTNTSVIEGPDASSKSLSYTFNRENVYLNGIKLLLANDYYQTNSSAITLAANAQSGDVLEVVIIEGTDSVKEYKYSVASNTLSISGADDTGASLQYVAGQEQVYLNGLKLIYNSDYTTPNATTITLTANAEAGDIVEVVTFPAQTPGVDLANTTFYGSNDTNLLTIDTFNPAGIRTAKYLVQANTIDSFQSSEAIIIHDGTTAYVAEYGVVYSNGSLYTLSADISGGLVRLRSTPSRSGTTFKTKRISLGV